MGTEVLRSKLEPEKPRSPMTLRLTKDAKKIMQAGRIIFDMDYSEVAESALREWASRHGLRDRLNDMGARIPEQPLAPVE